MFGSGFGGNSTAAAATSAGTSSDTTRAPRRRVGGSQGLFAVPEDREVLRTPQENANTGFVFGQGFGRASGDNGASPATQTAPITTTATTTQSTGSRAAEDNPFASVSFNRGVAFGSTAPQTVSYGSENATASMEDATPRSFGSARASASGLPDANGNALPPPCHASATGPDQMNGFLLNRNVPPASTSAAAERPFGRNHSAQQQTGSGYLGATGSGRRSMTLDNWSVGSRREDSSASSQLDDDREPVTPTRPMRVTTGLVLAPPSLKEVESPAVRIPMSSPADTAMASSFPTTLPTTSAQQQAPSQQMSLLQQTGRNERTIEAIESLSAEDRWNPIHGFVIPDPGRFVALEKEMDTMRAQRDGFAAQFPESEAQGSWSRFEAGVQALREQLDYDEVRYETEPRSWMQQYREQREAEIQERCETAKELKRMREMDEEEQAWITEEEKARREVALNNALELLRNAEERHQQQEPLSIDGLHKDEIQQLLPHPFSDSEYYLLPGNEDLETMVIGRGAEVLQQVPNVKIGRKDYGEISFNGPVNLEKLNVEEEIEIKRGHLLIKNIDRLAGIPATVTLRKVFRNLLFNVHALTEEALWDICAKTGAEFISYDSDGTWVFKVDSLAMR